MAVDTRLDDRKLGDSHPPIEQRLVNVRRAALVNPQRASTLAEQNGHIEDQSNVTADVGPPPVGLGPAPPCQLRSLQAG